MQLCIAVRAFGVVLLLLFSAPSLPAYSVLSHEAIIDTAWDGGIKPLLLARFPGSTPEDLKQAHAYAYAGCIIQDMGYYPFGSHFFSDLVHYVRSGDFILNLLRDSQDLDEYAFALGAMAHYAADTEGHSIAVNHAVPIDYPKLRRKYGDVVTYEDDPAAHLKVEFGFDVLQVARGNYAPQAYHDFIGFQVSKPVLERAFRDTYGLDMKDLFGDLDLALGTYRRGVSAVIPEMTRVAWTLKRKDLQKAHPGLVQRQFVYRLSRASYHKNWDGKFEQPGIGVHVLALFIRILPKVGPFRSLAMKAPTSQTDRMFEQSFDHAVEVYGKLLAGRRSGQLQLPNRDLDTGKPTRPGEYGLADDTYAKLATRLASHDPGSIDPGVRQAVLAYFGDLNQPFATRSDPKRWRETVAAVEKLKAEGSASRAQ